jgi:hypothetical protein
MHADERIFGRNLECRPLTIGGVYQGNMSTVTVEVRPAGVKTGQPPYLINATVSQILGVRSGAGIPRNPDLRLNFMVARENLTSAAEGSHVAPANIPFSNPLWCNVHNEQLC